MGWQTLVPIKGWRWWWRGAEGEGVLGVWAEPSQDCQLTGPDFSSMEESCFSGRRWVLGDWERGLPRAWKPETEYFKQTSTVCVPVSPAHPSDNQGHVITRALTNSGS